MDSEGIVIDSLRQILQKNHPKLIYSMPTFHNPTGVTLSAERREAVAHLCAEFEVPLIEDDAYSELRYEGQRIPVLKAFDTSGRIFYTSTFSKILVPGLRLGWVVGPKEVIGKLNIAQMGATVQVGTLVQHAIYHFLQMGLLESQIKSLCQAYQDRRDAMLTALSNHLQNVLEWNRPQGGFYIWCKMRVKKSVASFLEAALKEKVAFIPGDPFFIAGGGCDNTLRLSFSNTIPEVIREGIVRMAKVAKTI
jgi:2-aminoadipate transaminase